jgi:spermidine synthase
MVFANTTSSFGGPRLLALLVFLSGAASLIYEIVWIKRAALTFGSTTTSMASVLALFLAGLGLGGWLAGRCSVWIGRPWLWCAFIELALGIYGAGHPAAFAWADSFYGSLYRSSLWGQSDLIAARVGLMTLLLLPPTLLMGSTLPLICRSQAPGSAEAGRVVGNLYALNTVGAMTGCLAAGFVLLPYLGLLGTGSSAALLNGFTALGFARIAMQEQHANRSVATLVIANYPTALSRAERLALAGLFMVIGCVAMLNEVLWTRLLANVLRNTVHTYTLSLGVTLAGIALGSRWGGSLADRWATDPQRYLYLAGLLIGLGLCSLALPHLPPQWWWRLAGYGVVPVMLAFWPAALLSGMVVPIVCRLLDSEATGIPHTLGRLLGLNCLGCVLGAIGAGFCLLPIAGLAKSFALTAGLCFAAALVAWVCDGGARAWVGGLGSHSCLLALASGFVLLGTGLADRPIAAALLAHEDQVVAVAEGGGATLAVIERAGNRSLLLNQAWQGSATKTHQIMAAHVPMLHKPDARQVLTVGLGVGQTASRFLLYDIERLDVVEIEPRLFSFVREQFAAKWMADPRLHFVAEDGRTFVRHGVKNYDLVAIEVGQIYRPGVDQFYTREFYAEARTRLASGGMIVQFVPLQLLPATEFASVLRTFLAVFPEASLWYNTSELLLLGWRDTRPTLDVTQFRRLLEQPAIAEDLAFHYWGGPRQNVNQLSVLLGGFLAAGAELQALAVTPGSTIYTDDDPHLAYAVSAVAVHDRWAEINAQRIGGNLSTLAANVQDPDTLRLILQQAEAYRAANLNDMAAESWLDIAVDLQKTGAGLAVAAALDKALACNPHSRRALEWKASVLLAAQRQPEAEQYLRRLQSIDKR